MIRYSRSVDSTPNSYDLYLDGLKKYNENGYSTKL